MRESERTRLAPFGNDRQVSEEQLAFIPVKNTGNTSFSLAFDSKAGTLTLIGAGKQYQINLILEE